MSRYKSGDIIRYKQDKRIVQLVVRAPSQSSQFYQLIYIGPEHRGSQKKGNLWTYPDVTSSPYGRKQTLDAFDWSYELIERTA